MLHRGGQGRCAVCRTVERGCNTLLVFLQAQGGYGCLRNYVAKNKFSFISDKYLGANCSADLVVMQVLVLQELKLPIPWIMLLCSEGLPLPPGL